MTSGAHWGGGRQTRPAPCSHCSSPHSRAAVPGRPPALVETKGAAGLLLDRRHGCWLLVELEGTTPHCGGAAGCCGPCFFLAIRLFSVLFINSL
jgi:hypothetical protein